MGNGGYPVSPRTGGRGMLSGMEANDGDGTTPSHQITGTIPSPELEARIRPAQPDELVDAARVYQDAAMAESDKMRAKNPWVSDEARQRDLRAATDALCRLSTANPAAVLVAESDGVVVGMAGTLIRERHAHIIFLFVQPEWQGKGIGRELLERTRAVIDNAGADTITLTSSLDSRAWRRYLRFGLHPGPPLLSLRASSLCFPKSLPWQDALEPHEITTRNPEILNTVGDIDKAVKGVRRMNDFRRWLDEGATGALLTRRDTGLPVGYFLVSVESDGGQIGPLAAMDVERVPDVLQRALYHAGQQSGMPRGPWRVDLPSQNTVAIPPLFEAGFYPRNLGHWFANGTIGMWDRYIFRDEDQL